MSSPATPSSEHLALTAFAPVGAAVTGMLLPAIGSGAGGLQVALQAPVSSAWQQLSAAAAALASYLLQHSQAALLKQATQYCVALTDSTLQGISARLADPAQQMSLLGKSLLLAAVALMPASQAFCESLLQQLQVQAKALLENLQQIWHGEAAGYPALEAPAGLPALAPPPAQLAAALEQDFTPSGADIGWPEPEPPAALPQAPLAWPEEPASVCLVGSAEGGEFLPMT